MKISKHSWHYRLWKWGREYAAEPRDLCRYFWHLALVKVLLPAILVGLALTGIGALIYVIWEHPIVALIFLGVVGALAAVFIAIVVISGKIEDKRMRRRNGWEEQKEPGVVRQYLSARKRKICPLIEVVDK